MSVTANQSVPPILASQERDAMLDVALDISSRLAEGAVWHGTRCSWDVLSNALQSKSASQQQLELAGGSIYAGTCGIALFLAEAAIRGAPKHVVDAAIGAIVHALDKAERGEFPGTIGFFDWISGLAYASARVGALLGVPKLLSASRALLKIGEGPDYMKDIISGAAGAIPALLLLDRQYNSGTVDRALSLGKELVRGARREIQGWSWDTPVM